MAKPVVIGIDLGVNDSIIAYVAKGGVEVVQNEVSQRKTPTIVGFNDKERLLGDSAQTVVKSNLKNSCRNFRHLVRATLESEDFKKEKFWSLAELVEKDGFVGFAVNYRGEEQVYSCAQVIAMYLTKMRETAEAWCKAPVKDVCISVPAYYNDAQRQCMLDAAHIAGLHVIKLMNEHTATALAYGIYRVKDFDKETARTVAFCHMGHSNCSISIAKFLEGNLDVLSESSNRHCAGRDMDEVIMRYFAAEFNKKFGCDPLSSKKALLKLEEGASRVKKTLSANYEGSISIECLMEDEDLAGKMTRDQFEEQCAPLMERVQATIDDAMAKAGNPTIDYVEIIGGASRVPWFQQVCKDKFKKDLSFTLNADESVARGCALQGAILSPLYKVRDFVVYDRVFRPVSITWVGAGSAESVQDKDGDEEMEAVAESAGDNAEKKMVCFAVGDKMDSKKSITWHRNGPFEIMAGYSDSEQKDELGLFQFAMPSSEDKKKIKISVRMTHHGMFQMESCNIHQVEEYVDTVKEKREVEEEVEEPKKEEKMEVDGEKENAEQENLQEGDVAMSEAGTKSPPKEKKKKIVWVEVEKKKTRNKKTAVEIANNKSFGVANMGSLMDLETQMQATTKDVRETDAKRNDLETYIYARQADVCRDDGKYADCMLKPQRETFSTQLQTAEDWLYDHFEATKVELDDKLMELKNVGDVVVNKFVVREQVRDYIQEEVTKGLSDVRAQVNNPSEDYAHISDEKRQEVRNATDEFESWVSEMQQKQNSLAMTEEPIFTVEMIREKALVVGELAKKTMSERKPTPPKEEKKEEEEEKKEEAKEAKEGEEKEEEKKEGDEKMEGEHTAGAPPAKEEEAATESDVKMDGATQEEL